MPEFPFVITIVAEARVDHHAPCVPWCSVCYPLCERCGITHGIALHDGEPQPDITETAIFGTSAMNGDDN